MPNYQNLSFIFSENPIRIDILVAKVTNLSRTIAHSLILTKKVWIDDNLVEKKNQIVKTGQKVTILNDFEPPKVSLLPAKIDFELVFQDENLLVINKPKNLVVHPGIGNWDKTLVNGIIGHLQENLDELDQVRPGIIHRLDKDTTGLLLVAKNAKSHHFFANQLAKKEIKRFYMAIVVGLIPNKHLKINLPIARDPKNRLKKTISYFNSKNAVTYVELVRHFSYKSENFSLIKCQLETGRTHQIRIHLAHIGFPLYGDPLYGKKVDNLNQRLHAYKIIFTNIDGKICKFKTELPPEFAIAFQN
ncbi:RluA family pseudouridine synthase [Mycoplasma sp. 'Moose RK']|uniref:RluA family pseudouridine synthase n=1 Tax=Mycoplasma sp. 'Moose RK' TaxID=2780095 RepID=UPI0018C310A7|nr:RluA family pseudouridine synthase [Mycoplasma sp. 'Moose RK']MBG0730711.1 RluA family pseudouridine synthase [Mycoplasma sp. 'Moose RK']